mmetsp:Transcript_34802/g.76155  ORF Transcript_34802/g.76155 Transcript_34802/m.76155 type:complete len:377 (+) Transcript_34802:165-1295(+)
MQVGIVGASIAGLSVANVLHRKGFSVKIFEAFGHGFQNRGGALGFVDFDIVHRIRQGDKALTQSPTLTHPGMGSFYGTIWKYLYEGLPEGSVVFNAPVKDVSDETTDKPQIVLEDGSAHRFDFVVGADGGKSVVRQAVITQSANKESSIGAYSGYVVWRGLVKATEVDHAPQGIARYGPYTYVTLGFPCRDENGQILWNCGVYMPLSIVHVSKSSSGNRQVSTDTKRSVPDWLLPLLTHLFPDRENVEFWTTCMEKGKVSQHPVFEFAADRVVHNHMLLVGDAAHLITPRTGSGAYSAMLDAEALEEALEQTKTRKTYSLKHALNLYASDGRDRAHRFFRMSLSKKRQFMPADEFESPEPEELLASNEIVRHGRYF